MKAFIITVAFFSAAAALAEPTCDSGLSVHVGTYKLVSSKGSSNSGNPNCPYGQTLVVSKDQRGYALFSGGMWVGPGEEATSTDKCTVNGPNMTYQTCAYDGNCRPQWWEYDFTESGVIFTANGCTGTFTKVN